MQSQEIQTISSHNKSDENNQTLIYTDEETINKNNFRNSLFRIFSQQIKHPRFLYIIYHSLYYLFVGN